MVTLLRRLVLVLAFASVLPWSQSCYAAGLDGWGARYAQAEQSRIKAEDVKRVEMQAQGLVAFADDGELPKSKVTDREVAVELLRLTASLLVPGLGIVLWLAD